MEKDKETLEGHAISVCETHMTIMAEEVGLRVINKLFLFTQRSVAQYNKANQMGKSMNMRQVTCCSV